MNGSEATSVTRRRILRTSVGAVGTLGIAGCQSGAEEAASATGDTPAENEGTATVTDEQGTTTGDAATASGSYSVSMEPVGEVTFESVPDRWMTYYSTYGDIGIALGQLDGLGGLFYVENWPTVFYDWLPGVDVSFKDVQKISASDGIDREVFYEMDYDIHLMDPNMLTWIDDNWSESDVEDVRTEVGPFVGNHIRRRGYEWHDYRPYSLYEAFETVAEVFQERERYDVLREVHDRLLADLQAGLPPEDDRPSVGFLSVNSDIEAGTFYAYPLGAGNGKKQYRDLRIDDAFADDIDGAFAEWDYEQLLSADPDALVFLYGFSHTSAEDFESGVEQLRDDPVGSQLTAVDEDRLYRGGTEYQGPIINLFQTEAAAKQLYPDQFGAWNGLGEPLPEAERLFDYQRVADAINGRV
ncbi:ABC transporter substrate-binding protein (plasmid) [Haloarcula sp. NS06]|uniref:ABC transporter substrate-binding protein n=1 Tax=Haloarcula sp. NS06 TaxID=3409688 RepID=UPI003DA794EC